MLTAIISMVIVVSLIATDKILDVISRILTYGVRRKEEKAARKAAMERYMNMHALDIEH